MGENLLRRRILARHFRRLICLWIPGSKEISVESRQWIDSIRARTQNRGIPPPPSIFGIITLARNSRQNTFFKELNSQNLENKELSFRGLTPWALHPLRSMIAQMLFEKQGWMSHDWRIRLWKKRWLTRWASGAGDFHSTPPRFARRALRAGSPPAGENAGVRDDPFRRKFRISHFLNLARGRPHITNAHPLAKNARRMGQPTSGCLCMAWNSKTPTSGKTGQKWGTREG